MTNDFNAKRKEAWNKLADQITDYINQYGVIDLWLDYGREYHCITTNDILDRDHPAIIIQE